MLHTEFHADRLSRSLVMLPQTDQLRNRQTNKIKGTYFFAFNAQCHNLRHLFLYAVDFR